MEEERDPQGHREGGDRVRPLQSAGAVEENACPTPLTFALAGVGAKCGVGWAKSHVHGGARQAVGHPQRGIWCGVACI